MNIHRTAYWRERREETSFSNLTYGQWGGSSYMADFELGSPNEKRDSKQTIKVLSSEVRLVDHIPGFCTLTRMSE
jgi:hypothetical protein